MYLFCCQEYIYVELTSKVSQKMCQEYLPSWTLELQGRQPKARDSHQTTCDSVSLHSKQPQQCLSKPPTRSSIKTTLQYSLEIIPSSQLVCMCRGSHGRFEAIRRSTEQAFGTQKGNYAFGTTELSILRSHSVWRETVIKVAAQEGHVLLLLWLSPCLVKGASWAVVVTVMLYLVNFTNSHKMRVETH